LKVSPLCSKFSYILYIKKTFLLQKQLYIVIKT